MYYKTIQKDIAIEDNIKKSRFICHLKRVSNEDEARTFIASVKKKHHRANHSCSAMIIGEKSELKRSSDDGEPSGTAGIPILSVLEKQALTNIVAVVTRYFGGIKLGTGGLVRAYAGSVSKAIEASNVIIVKEQAGIEVTLNYQQYQVLNQFLAKYQLPELNTQFLDHVTSQIYADQNAIAEICDDLYQFYQGKVTYKDIGHKIVEIPYLKE